VRSAAAYGDTVVYEAGGRLKSLDLGSGQIRSIPIHLSVQSNQARPQWKDAGKNITSASLSPTDKRVLITARGDVFSVPVKDGSVRNLTATSGVREADALWSKDGQRVAYLSDEGGAQSLLIRDALGLEKPHVENEGVAPDLDVPLDPIAVNEGRDSQLDAALAEVLEELKTAKPIPLKDAPPMPMQVGR
jgi:Tol biopolymer transport system component